MIRKQGGAGGADGAGGVKGSGDGARSEFVEAAGECVCVSDGVVGC